MATYLELADLLEQPQFKRRIRFALMVAAGAALSNAQAPANVKTYARQILAADIPENDMRRVVLRCVLSAAVQAAGEAVADEALQTVVDNLFASLAP